VLKIELNWGGYREREKIRDTESSASMHVGKGRIFVTRCILMGQR